MGAIPEYIAGYRIIRPIGHGGMGSVYLAEDPQLDILVAIKLLKEDSPDLRLRFIREARTSARLKHPNIVQIFAAGVFKGQPYIAMEYVSGETLAEMIKRRALSSHTTQKLALLEALCDGLAYAHKKGVIHRDIKPLNIMVDGDGAVRILDFGIARIESSGMTRSGVIMGTLNYMSPEMISGVPIDLRSDMFAVGAVIYEFLCYRQAFPGRLPEVLARILHDPPDQWVTVCPSLDPELLAIVERCLTKDPRDRYPDLTALGAELRRVRERMENEAQETTSASSQPLELVDPSGAMAAAIEDVESALSRMNVDDARAALEQVREVAGPMAALPFERRLSDIVHARQSQQWLDEARAKLSQGELTAAYEIALRLEAIPSSQPQMLSLLEEVEQRRSERESDRATRQRIENELNRASRAYEDRAFELAIQLTQNVLALDEDNETARTLYVKAEQRLHDTAAEEAVSRWPWRIAAARSRLLFPVVAVGVATVLTAFVVTTTRNVNPPAAPARPPMALPNPPRIPPTPSDAASRLATLRPRIQTYLSARDIDQVVPLLSEALSLQPNAEDLFQSVAELTRLARSRASALRTSVANNGAADRAPIEYQQGIAAFADAARLERAGPSLDAVRSYVVSAESFGRAAQRLAQGSTAGVQPQSQSKAATLDEAAVPKQEEPPTPIRDPPRTTAAPRTSDMETAAPAPAKPGASTDVGANSTQIAESLADQRAIEQLLVQYERAYEGRDADAVARLTPMDAATVRRLQQAFRESASYQMQIDPEQPVFAADRMSATITAMVTIVQDLRAGRTPGPNRTKRVFEFEKTNGVWRIARVQ